MKDVEASLLFAPAPIPGESPASWLLRTSIVHEVTTKAILRSLDIGQCADPDIDLPIQSLRTIARGTGVSDTYILDLAESFRYVRRDHAKENLVRDRDDFAAYCYCPLCLRSDRIPHLRSLWRFELWTICPIHRVRMLDSCHRCGAAIHAHRSESVALVASLLECPHCHCDYAPQTVDVALSELDVRRLENQHLFVSLIKEGGALSELAINTLYAERVASYLSFKSYSQRLYRRARSSPSPAVEKTGDAFAS